MLVRLLYASRAVDPSHVTIQGILEAARARNQASGITGILVYGSDIFMQVIEGGRQAVSDLYGTIQRSPRHKDVILLHYEEIVERHFSAWTMGLVDISRVNASALIKYSERAELDPYGISGKASIALMEELMATASIVGHI